jgi:hypothetical protein
VRPPLRPATIAPARVTTQIAARARRLVAVVM